MTLITTDKVKVTVSSMSGDWAKVDGTGGSYAIERVRETAGGAKVVLSSEYEPTEITVSRIFDAKRDAPIIKQLQESFTPYENSSITVQYLVGAGVEASNEYHGCAVQSWTGPSGDANGDGVAELQVTWAVGAV